MEAPWSPAYYSLDNQQTWIETRVEFPTSPSSSRYRSPYGDFSDKSFERVPEDYNRPPINTHSIYEQQPQEYSDNVVLIQAGPVVNEKAGFPGNILQGSNAYEGNSICENCRMTFQRNQVYPEQPHVEPTNVGNGYLHAPNSWTKTILVRCILETHGHERGWVSPHQPPHPWAEEPRPHLSVSGRLTDGYVMENDQRYARPGVDYGGSQVFQDQAVATGSQVHLPSMEDRGVRYGNPNYPYGTDNVYQVPHGHIPPQSPWRNVHGPFQGGPAYETPVSSQLVNGSVPMGFIRSTVEGSPRVRTGAENQNPWTESSQKIVGFDGSLMPDYNTHIQAVKFSPNTHTLENHHPCTLDSIQSASLLAKPATYRDPASLIDGTSVTVAPGVDYRNDTETNNSVRVNGNSAYEGRKEKSNGAEAKDSCVCGILDKNSDALAPSVSITLNFPERAVENGGAVNETNATVPEELPDDRLEFLPELIASVKEAALKSLKEVKAKVQEDTDLGGEHDSAAKEDTQNHKDGVDGNVDLEVDSDYDNVNPSKIELTKAEAEAIDRGLQTIKNEDLEEIRELGSGTYGSVYHGKWKGSDVAIKRIKASCFAGRPSERERLDPARYDVLLYGTGGSFRLRHLIEIETETEQSLTKFYMVIVIMASANEKKKSMEEIGLCIPFLAVNKRRLIADFWKEALILSSLHHPNVVSFYGVVRDGPDGSLATVTEFMVNGSLKQFLQKKDRTIDRRKRLIIAMDAAFGMEYLHGKNIVHFDLKCENLLVNMRDPHRPVCKIGDLGLSKVKQHTLVSGGVRGTLPWMAPELLSGKSNMVTEKIDVYSFGICMWELLTGDEPYTDMHCASIIGGIVNNSLRPQIPTWCDPEWKSLMESCWASDPSQRPSFSEIAQRPLAIITSEDYHAVLEVDASPIFGRFYI
ncbi:hypothetical protein DH2020_039214 [Rehmannia glutinosa]|uniref:Protein kinase domain-containing protein n=1 Tax=Rehmannia glutinosa TaxID=99300 RepID=A0ABR0UXM3_REHGL